MCQFGGHLAKCRQVTNHLPGTICPSTEKRAILPRGRGTGSVIGAAGLLILTMAIGPRILDAIDPDDEVPAPKTGRVVDVIDGDSLLVRVGRREWEVRLVGIDAPDHTTGECYADQSADWLAQQLPAGTRVRLTRDSSQPGRDRYQRRVRYVEIPNRSDLDVGKRAVATGHARLQPRSKVGGDHDRTADYQTATQRAQGNHRGLWAAC